MRPIRQLLSGVLAAMILVSALFGAALPASAHDVAESTSPASGATLASPPEKVSITFNRNPLSLGSQILVSDAAGNSWSDGSVEIVDNIASQQLKPGAPAGAYTVAWRIVSSDSHPIEGTFTFTATSGAPNSTAAAAVPTLSTPQPGVTETPAPVPNAAEPFPWSLVIFIATAVGILVALAVMAKRRLTADDGPAAERQEEPGTASRTGDGDR